MIEVREDGGASSFLVRVQPRAGRNAIDGEWQGALRIRLNAPPIDGRANEALRRLLADRLNVPLAAVKITSGEKSRIKRVEVSGVRAEEIHAIESISESRNFEDRGSASQARPVTRK